jgi:hypothetical protein
MKNFQSAVKLLVRPAQARMCAEQRRAEDAGRNAFVVLFVEGL